MSSMTPGFYKKIGQAYGGAFQGRLQQEAGQLAASGFGGPGGVQGGLTSQGFTKSGRLPPRPIAAQVQLGAEQAAAERNAGLAQEAGTVLQSGLKSLQSYRPGGAAALTSPYYQGIANTLLANRMNAPDLMFDYRRDEEFQNRRRANNAQNLQTGLAIGGTALSAAGGIIGALSAPAAAAGGVPPQGGLLPGQAGPPVPPGWNAAGGGGWANAANTLTGVGNAATGAANLVGAVKGQGSTGTQVAGGTATEGGAGTGITPPGETPGGTTGGPAGQPGTVPGQPAGGPAQPQGPPRGPAAGSGGLTAGQAGPPTAEAQVVPGQGGAVSPTGQAAGGATQAQGGGGLAGGGSGGVGSREEYDAQAQAYGGGGAPDLSPGMAASSVAADMGTTMENLTGIMVANDPEIADGYHAALDAARNGLREMRGEDRLRNVHDLFEWDSWQQDFSPDKIPGHEQWGQSPHYNSAR